MPSDSRFKRRRNFYWNGKLHRVLKISRPLNLVDAWCFSDRASVTLLYTDWKRNTDVALRTSEVARMLRTTPKTIKKALYREELRFPERSYSLDGEFNPWAMYWSPDHVLELHDALMMHHRGRPRKDKKIRPASHYPSRAEVKAQLRNEDVLYVKTSDGSLVPVFDAFEW